MNLRRVFEIMLRERESENFKLWMQNKKKCFYNLLFTQTLDVEFKGKLDKMIWESVFQTQCVLLGN